MAQFRYLDQAGNLTTVPVSDGPFVIGRNTTCQITFIDDMVSREHTKIEREPSGRYRVRDLGSRNKTYINGQLIGESLLQPGDLVRVGDHVLEFVEDGAQRQKVSLEFLTPDRKDPEGTEWIKIKAPVPLGLGQIERLSGLTADLGMTARPEDVADAALGQLIIDVQAERGFVAMRGEGKKEIRPVAHRGLTPTPTGALMPVSETFVYSTILQSVAGRYPQDAKHIDSKAGYAATGLVAPLTLRETIIGLIYVDRPVSKKPFSLGDLHYTAAAGAHIGARMADASVRLTQNAVRQGAAWLSTLRRLQTSMSSPQTKGQLFEAVWKLFPGQGRCGDFCDVFELDDHRAVVLTVDAGGHGMAGLVQAAAIRGGIATALRVGVEDLNIAEVMAALNRSLAGQQTRQLVACTVVLLNASSAQITYVNAGGMPPMLLTGPGRLVTLDHPSLLLGVDADYPYESSTVDVPVQFRLVCHTDGLTGAVNAAGEAFGEQRLHEVLLDRASFVTPPEIIGRVGDALEAHSAGAPLLDDALVCVLGRG